MEFIISINKMNKNKTVKSHCQMKDSVSEITVQPVCSASRFTHMQIKHFQRDHLQSE